MKKNFLFILFCILLSAGFSRPGMASIPARYLPEDVLDDGEETQTIYFPVIRKLHPLPPTIFGVELNALGDDYRLSLASEANNYWIRNSTFDWSRIEPENTTPDQYNWASVDERKLSLAGSTDMKIIAKVQFTPDWAQLYPAVKCGPIKPENLKDFAEFLHALVERYSVPPYNIQYWELGNEPDIDHSLVPSDSIYGCWGDIDDPYYGGGAYADMLKVAYPAIKSAAPNAQVLIGGLLMDCDPTHPPAGRTSSYCKPSYFLKGILANGGSPYFDIVSFHGYPQYWNGLINDETFASWSARGGVVLGKVSFIREVLNSYGISKQIFHTEGSLICPESNPSCANLIPGHLFYDRQADYVVWLYVRNIALNVTATIWYQFDGPGWRESGMLDEDQIPKPAYDAYKYLTGMLKGSTYVRRVDNSSGLRVYEFALPQKRVWVLWSPEYDQVPFKLPASWSSVTDKYGGTIVPENGYIVVSSPVYIELDR